MKTLSHRIRELRRLFEGTPCIEGTEKLWNGLFIFSPRNMKSAMGIMNHAHNHS